MSELHKAILDFNHDKLKELLADPDIDLNVRGERNGSPGHTAAFCNNAVALELLLKDVRYDLRALNDKNGTILHVAAFLGHIDAMRAILNNDKIDVNAKDTYGATALDWCMVNNSQNPTEVMLIDDRCSKNKFLDPQYPVFLQELREAHKAANKIKHELHTAILDFNHKKLKELLADPDTDLNVRGERNSSAGHTAAFCNNAVALELLLKHPGYDVNALNDHNGTILHVAASRNSLDPIMAILKDGRIDVNAKDSRGVTAIDCAVINMHTSALTLMTADDPTEFYKYPTEAHKAAVNSSK